MLMDDMLFSDGSEFRLGSIVPNLKFFIVPMAAVTLITFTVLSYAATRQVTMSESMLMIFVAIHCEHAFGDGGTFAKVPPSPLPGKGALTHHLHSGHPQACGLRVATHLRSPFRACSVLVAFQATFDTGGGIPSGTCALRGVFRSLRRATGTSI